MIPANAKIGRANKIKKNAPRCCLNCGRILVPDPRLGNRQQYCSKPACIRVSRRAAQLKWSRKRDNRDHFKGSENVARVREWRLAHPQYWRDRRARARAKKAGLAVDKSLYAVARKLALQDAIDTQFSLLVGLVSQLTGHTLQDAIANHLRRSILEGHGILRQNTKGSHPRRN